MFGKSKQLFVAFGSKREGAGVSKQAISRWITSCVALSYELKGHMVAIGLRAPSTRGTASTKAFRRSPPVIEICKATTWASPHTFTSHYCIDVATRADASFGREVLRNVFN